MIGKGSGPFKNVGKTGAWLNQSRIELRNITMSRVPVIIFILPHDGVVDSDHYGNLGWGKP